MKRVTDIETRGGCSPDVITIAKVQEKVEELKDALFEIYKLIGKDGYEL